MDTTSTSSTSELSDWQSTSESSTLRRDVGGNSGSSSSNSSSTKKREVRSDSPPPLNRLQKTPWKTLFLSLFLTFAGLILLITGTHNWGLEDYWNSLLYLVLALMLLTPGVYHLHIIVRTLLGHEGYSYDLLTQIDD